MALSSKSTKRSKPASKDDLLVPPPALDENFVEQSGMEVDKAIDKEDILDWDDAELTERPSDDAATPGSNEHNRVVRGGDPKKRAKANRSEEKLQQWQNKLVETKVALGVAQAMEKHARGEAERLRGYETEAAKLRERIEWHKTREEQYERTLEARNKEILDLGDDLRLAKNELYDRRQEVALLRDKTQTQDEPDRKRARHAEKARDEGGPAAEDNEHGEVVMTDVERTSNPGEEESSEQTYASVTSNSSTGVRGYAEKPVYQRAERTPRAPVSFQKQVNQLNLPTIDSIGYSPLPPLVADVRDQVDNRGYPITKIAWERQFLQSVEQHLWVYGFRMFAMWVYSRSIPAAMRNEAQQWAIDHYYMADWFSETLSALAHQETENRELIARFKSTGRSDLDFNVLGLAQMIQYQEHAPRGCPFIDDSWTLCMRDVRGAMLMEVLSVDRAPKHHHALASECAAHTRIEKMLITLLAMPNLYMTRVTDLDVLIADEFAPHSWPLATAGTTTEDDIIWSMAEQGVLIEMVEDVYQHALKWITEVAAMDTIPLGWDAGEAAAIIARSNDVPAPLGLADDNVVVPRHPMLPWKSKSEQIVQYELWDWRNPHTQGMKREPNSRIQAIASRVGRYLELNNPWTTRSKDSSNPLATRAHPLARHMANAVAGPSTADAGPSSNTRPAPIMLAKRVRNIPSLPLRVNVTATATTATAVAAAVPNAAAAPAAIPTAAAPTMITDRDPELAAVDAVIKLALDAHGDTPMLEYDEAPPQGAPEL
ncbi:hypothetical protein DFH09DRAFT_1328999 [Mycena vulgaris]|nr:hypothetical protein DFH09DRAFT_1328999 [Mycena vulgaris]